jgi:hypothetical protein
VPGQVCFTYLRLYAPTEVYFDKTWPLADIETSSKRLPRVVGYFQAAADFFRFGFCGFLR